MSYSKLILIVLYFLLTGCGTESNPDERKGYWKEMDLHDLQVLTLSFSNDILLAGTENGAYKTKVGDDVDWREIGLDADTTEVTKIISWDVKNILATVSYDTIREEDKVLFESMDGGNSWKADL